MSNGPSIAMTHRARPPAADTGPERPRSSGMGSKFSKGVRMHEKIHSRVRLDRTSASKPNTGSVGAHSTPHASKQLFLFLLRGIEGGLDFLRMLFDLCLQRGPCDLSWRTAFIAETYGCLTGQPSVCIGALGPGTQSFCFISFCRSNGASPSRVVVCQDASRQ